MKYTPTHRLYLINPHLIKHHKISCHKAFKYAKEMENGTVFPPVKIYKNNNGTWHCKDGAHRIFAAKLSGAPVIVKTKNIPTMQELADGLDILIKFCKQHKLF